jgi:hypothetical protein
VKLAELERYFASAATSGSGPLPELDGVFLGSPQLSATDRLGIYNRSYFNRLLAALASVFSQTKRILGDSDFERLGLAYLAQNPSEHPAVERVGRSFSEFLRGGKAPATIVDLASLEWARLCALLAPNPKSIATVRSVEPSQFPRARLRFVPSLQRLELDPRALAAFAAEGARLTEPLADDSPSSPCAVAVWRSQQHAVVHQVVGAQEWTALARATEGATLSRVCAVFDSGSQVEDVGRAFQVLSTWFARCWLEEVETDEMSTNSR